MHVCMFLGHPSQPLKRHLDRFRRFCWAYERDQQTDTQTDRPRLAVCVAISRYHYS